MGQSGNSPAKTSTWSRMKSQRRGNEIEEHIDRSNQNRIAVVFLTFHKPPKCFSDVLRVDRHLYILRNRHAARQHTEHFPHRPFYRLGLALNPKPFTKSCGCYLLSRLHVSCDRTQEKRAFIHCLGSGGCSTMAVCGCS
jgi:hypothetical protein